MLLHDARRDTRTDDAGDVVLLEDQDRSRWDRAQIDEALALVPLALRGGGGPYALEAAIAALHAPAARAADTDWAQIAALYAERYRRAPSPIVALNHAVAIAMAEGPAAGLALVEPLRTAARRLPPVARRARRSAAPARPSRRSGKRLSPGARARRQRSRAPLSRASNRAVTRVVLAPGDFPATGRIAAARSSMKWIVFVRSALPGLRQQTGA